jgi:hypothetical protein
MNRLAPAPAKLQPGDRVRVAFDGFAGTGLVVSTDEPLRQSLPRLAAKYGVTLAAAVGGSVLPEDAWHEERWPVVRLDPSPQLLVAFEIAVAPHRLKSIDVAK